MITAKTPWNHCNVVFGIDDDAALWTVHESGRLASDLPAGWSFSETDGAGWYIVAVFRVNGAPSLKDGIKVLSMLRRIGAVTGQAAANREARGDG